jgi:hypothetical protein
MSAEIEIYLGEVNDVEGQVFARYVGAMLPTSQATSQPVVLCGTLRGPYCKLARTLPAAFAFRDLGTKPGLAIVTIPDPCVWSRELPHLYHVDVEARQDDRVIAAYHGQIGLRRKEDRNERTKSESL